MFVKVISVPFRPDLFAAWIESQSVASPVVTALLCVNMLNNRFAEHVKSMVRKRQRCIVYSN